MAAIDRRNWTCPHCGGYDAGGLILHCSGCGRPATASGPDDRPVTLRLEYEEDKQTGDVRIVNRADPSPAPGAGR